MNKGDLKLFFTGFLAGLILLAVIIGVHGCLGYRERVKNAVSDEHVIWDRSMQSLNISRKMLPEATDRIAFVTYNFQSEEVVYAVEEVAKKYGKNMVVHAAWPDNFMQEQEQMIEIVTTLAKDESIKALIIDALPGSIAALDKLQETRPDMFIIMCMPQENPADVMIRADLVLDVDDLGMAPAMVEQAQKLGAKTFVHYSFPRHMSQPLLSSRRELIQEKCEGLGIEFVNATVPDPTSDVGVAGAQQFIVEDVPKMIDHYGKDTAFFATNCSMQIPLIKSVSDNGGIYPQPCCPSPYHGFVSALGIEMPEEGLADRNYVIDESKRILKEKGVSGRFSTWPISAYAFPFYVAGEYAFKWMAGEVPKQGLDMQVLQQCLEDYAGVKVYANSLVDDGVTYDNWLLLREDYITY